MKNQKKKHKGVILKGNTLSKEKGITLIALVVTIVVMLILAATAIATLTGDSGIITNAQKARMESKKAEVLERMRSAYNSVQTEAMTKMTTQVGYRPVEKIKELAELAAKELGVEAEEAEVPEKVEDGKYHVYYRTGGATITMLYGDATFSLKAMEAPRDNQYPNIKTAIFLSTGKVQFVEIGANAESNGMLGIIMPENTPYTDSEGNTAIIPAGFCAVLNTTPISQGLVISDVEDDDINNSKGGNQFVWIPVDGTNLKYEQHTYATTSVDDHINSIADTGNGGWKTYQYRNYTGWTDTGGNAESVAENKGFYIGRYEAGIPANAPFYSETTYYQSFYNNDTLGSNSLTEGSYVSTYKSKNTASYKPVSKKNTPSWNFINPTNAKAASSKMYEGSSSVTSSLIDSYAWDTITQWLSNTGHNVTDSTSWGNYYNASFGINGLYARHEYTSRWLPAYTWSKGTYIKSGAERTETATGSVERNKANNIYDFAGNMWEWTTETRTGPITYWSGTTDSTGSGTFAVLRGGGVYYSGSDYSASYRFGRYGIGNTYPDVGFRVVLYIK